MITFNIFWNEHVKDVWWKWKDRLIDKPSGKKNKVENHEFWLVELHNHHIFIKLCCNT